MPLTLIVLMTLIQDAPFRDYKGSEIPVLILNEDGGELANTLILKLKEAEIFEIRTDTHRVENADHVAGRLEKEGYKAIIQIKQNATKSLNKALKIRVLKTFDSFAPVRNQYPNIPVMDDLVKVYWDPVIKKSMKDGLNLALDKVLLSYQSEETLNLVENRLQKLSGDSTLSIETSALVKVDEKSVSSGKYELAGMNSVQHNVPAWTIFGIFFMVVPLAGNLIKEREQKTFVRLHLIPGSLSFALIGKIGTYLLVACSQFILIVLAGKFLMPILGLPALYTGNNFAAISLVVMALGMAAAGYGVFVGTVSGTIQQASTIGSVSIVILAAIGGVWVPVFIMPYFIQILSEISPMAWGMIAFNNLFLKGYGIVGVLPEVVKLGGFSVITFCLSYLIEKKRKPI